MDTMSTDKKRLRRNHTPALKAQILAECAAPGASVAKVAMAHRINANIVHGWRKQAREQCVAPVVAPAAFVPLAIEASTPPTPSPAPQHIGIEVRRGAVSITTSWPLSSLAELTAWTRELLR